MNRDDFRRISVQRRREAKALLSAGFYPGAYYLCGYAVECALKACIAKQTRRYDFPVRRTDKIYTHDLEVLLGQAGLASELEREQRQSRALRENWLIVKDWSEASRYETVIPRSQASGLYSACVGRTHGILTWIGRRW